MPNTSSRIRQVLLIATVSIALWFAGAASLSAQAGTGHFEGYLGVYSPESDALGDEATFGIRTGYQFNDHWGYLFQVGRYSTSEVFPILTAEQEEIDLDLWILDFSFAWYQKAGNHEGFNVFFGPGLAFTDLEASAFEDQLDIAADDSYTLHAGVGWNFMPGDQFKVRPDVRARWFEASDDAIDFEATVSIGWLFQ